MENISATAQNRRALQITFALTLACFVVQVVGAILTNSLALLADAAHMLTDVGGLALALLSAPSQALKIAARLIWHCSRFGTGYAVNS